MSRYYSYINSAVLLINQFTGKEPFNIYLKKYFAANKKYGSKDRKLISHLCYCYFRLGKSLKEMNTEARLLAGLFLCSSISNDILDNLKPEWNNKVQLSAEEKFDIIYSENGIDNNDSNLRAIFPWEQELSKGLDYNDFCNSFFTQPDLFLRLRPGKESVVKQKLIQAGAEFTIISHSCISLPNSTKIDKIIDLDKEVVIQDYSSQQVAEFLNSIKKNKPEKIWDCCAASGGKSILTTDIIGEIDLTVSDIRQNILINLNKRFAAAGIKNYKSKLLDVGSSVYQFEDRFDLIISDVPCSGSGTWSRTPEQLYYFDKIKIDEYSSLQKKIIINVMNNLKDGGFLLYITCSVFSKENEKNVEFMKDRLKLHLVEMKLLKGYRKKADTMFAALLQKTSIV